VGNLTVGGTGKTPLALHLIDALLRRRYKVGVVSRGYPISPAKPAIVTPEMDARECGDEPLLYARAGVPTVVCAQRVRALEALLAHAPDVEIVLADDALQHTALPRDVEICVVDGARGFGNGRTLPAGPLREPVSRLQSVDAVVVHGDGAFSTSHANLFRMRLAITGLRTLAGEQVLATSVPEPASLVAGIGQPQKFFDEIRRLFPSLRNAHAQAFADHYAFTASELAALPGRALVMTEKDAMRCAKIAPEIEKPVFVTTTHTTVALSLTDWLIAQLEHKGYGRKTT
jgi:tetraacyldisaccharide 4'-kinase